MNRTMRAVGWLAFLGTAVVALRLAAVGELSAPPAGSIRALEAWVEERSLAASAIALVRLASELAAWYLLAISVLHVLGATMRFRGVHALADALALPGATRLLRAALGMGLAVSATSTGTHPTAAAPISTAERIPHAHPGTVLQERIGTGTATMRPVEADDGHGTALMIPVSEAGIEDESTEAPRPTTWRVEEGESFWSIAEAVLEDTWGRHPTDHEIDPFWRALVDANRDRLVTGDPDLVLPGQVFEVPPVRQLD